MYAIANCDTVKKAKSFLEKHKVVYEFIDFKKNPPTKDLIKEWTKYFGELPVNKKGTTYKKVKDQYEKLSEAGKIDFMISQSSMIKRPIIEKNGKVITIGFDEEQYLTWIK
jgi:Spx/MgsR family transcriptional regulator